MGQVQYRWKVSFEVKPGVGMYRLPGRNPERSSIRPWKTLAEKEAMICLRVGTRPWNAWGIWDAGSRPREPKAERRWWRLGRIVRH